MADYLISDEVLKDTADAIREKTGETGKIIPKNWPAEIRSISSGGPLTLGEDKIARFSYTGSEYVSEVSYTLWKLGYGSAENLSGSEASAWGFSYDFSHLITSAGSYFVTCTAFAANMTAIGHYVSNVLTLKPWMVKLDTNGVARISDEAMSCGPYDIEWRLRKVGENEPCDCLTYTTYYYDFSTRITELGAGDYYVSIVLYNEDYQVLAAYESDPVHFDGGDENWLFQNEYMNTTPKTVYDANGNPIVPVVGTSYTLFVDGVEIAYNTATDKGGAIGVVLSIVTPDNSVIFTYVGGMGGWYFNSTDSKVKSGTVSIRVND